MADISFIGSATGSGAAGANASINVGGISGIADGDFLVVMSAVYVRAAGDGLATTNGSGSFIEPVNALTSNSTRRLRVAHKFRSGDTTITIAGTGNASDAVSGIVMAFRDVDPTTPLDVTPTTATGSSSAPNAPAIVPTTDRTQIIACAASPIRDTSIGTPTGFTTSLYATPISQTNNAEIGAARRSTLLSPAASFDPASFGSWTTTSNIWVAATLALRPGEFVAGVGDAWDDTRFEHTLYTFTDSNRTAIKNSGTAGTVISQASHDVGKYFASFTCHAGSSPDIDIGLWDGLAESSGYPSAGWWYNTVSGEVGIIPASAIGDVGASGDGDIVDIAVDLTTWKLWGRVNGGDWNSSGTADPTTGVGGFDMSGTKLAEYYLYNNAGVSGYGWTVNTGTVEFTYAPPSGFSNWYGSPNTELTASPLATGAASLGHPALTINADVSLTANSLEAGKGGLSSGDPTSYWPAESDTSPGGGTIVGSVTYGAGELGNAFTIPNSAGSYVFCLRLTRFLRHRWFLVDCRLVQRQ